MDLEGGLYSSPSKRDSWRTVLTLAYQSLGVVYGDLSTSPLYVYKSTFAEDIQHSETNEEIYGVLSFVFWTLTLVPLLKYVFIVLRADDNGEGGTFALYSLLCRHARVGFLPNGQLADEELSAYKKGDGIGGRGGRGALGGAAASRVRRMLEKHQVLQRCLLVLALIGTCMVIGDGVLTPAISGGALTLAWTSIVLFGKFRFFPLPLSLPLSLFFFESFLSRLSVIWQFFRRCRGWSFQRPESSISVREF